MKQRRPASAPNVLLLLLIVASAAAPRLHAQASPTATRSFGLSAFGGASGVYTGLAGGRNLSITAGGDIGFRRFFSLYPALELRGTYPINSGTTDSQKVVLGGLRLARPFGRLHPYLDILAGRGSITYNHGFLDATGTTVYLENPSNVFSGGGGLDFDLTPRFGIKADGQYQRFNTPVTSSGHLYAKPLTLAVVFHFGVSTR